MLPVLSASKFISPAAVFGTTLAAAVRRIRR
jgi:hypothetical protein